MTLNADKYKGIHPGSILERELKKRSIVKSHFAEKVKEHPQTLNAIYKGKRKLPIALCFKIDDALSFEEGTMYNLQSQYEIHEYIKNFRKEIPELASQLRPGLFWDTDIHKIDWKSDSEAIIKRVLERGNEAEKKIIIDLYGEDKVENVLREMYQNHFSDINRNLTNFGWHLSLNSNEADQNEHLFLPFNINSNKGINYNPFKKYSIPQNNEQNKAAEPIERLIKKSK